MLQARICRSRNVLIALSGVEHDSDLLARFCGTVMREPDVLTAARLTGMSVYLCGDISRASGLEPALAAAAQVFVVRELSRGYDATDSRPKWSLVDAGRVPLLVHGVGVFYRRFFDPAIDYFALIQSEHVFQSLTESTKSSKAHRAGIYLTPVEASGDELRFRLLRCSTNLSGPTDSFRSTDWHIVGALKQEAARIFEDHAPLNHVLAQVYPNLRAADGQKQAKAKIKSHADKTKDMPANGIMAFCTFYDRLDGLQRSGEDPYDYGYKSQSALTRLEFRLKDTVALEPGSDLPAQFSITLYPGSAFFMPLSTNRMYTHEIRSSVLDAAMLPTRLGYVVRCSSTEAVHRGGATYIRAGDELVALEPPTPEGVDELRRLYAEENRTDALIDYGDRFRFSMNEGDYRAPSYHPSDELRRYTLSVDERSFEQLAASVRFEDVAKGRRGAVLVEPHETRGIPIVRTTTKYREPAQRFSPMHARLVREIARCASLPVAFDNALVELYGDAYRKMGFHSDQVLDLEPGSFIALFSCYRRPRERPSRKLVVESKGSASQSFEIPLTHNSVVLFSLDTNRRFRHKIELEAPGNDWLGFTLRKSRTFIRYGDEGARFEDGTPLTIADEASERELYSLRSRENREPDFVYPRITCTLSASDLVPPRAP